MAALAPISGGSGEPDHSITALLAQLNAGDCDAEGRLISQVYAELRRLAERHMRRERPGHTLQPTALVNEAYVRLVREQQAPWKDRNHFFGTAATLMRYILVDHARAKQAAKRPGSGEKVELDSRIAPWKEQSIDVLALHQILERLETLDARQARIVELHFFAGLNFAEIGEVVGLSERTVKRDWSMARAWLKTQLTNPE